MFYLTAFPNTKFFEWQIKVQHYNFIVEKGIPPSDIVCLIGHKNDIDNDFDIYLKKVGVKVFYYDITNEDMSYSPRIRPLLYAKFYKENPQYVNQHVFIHDSDITFTNKPKFVGFTNHKWYLSDCNDYLNYDYLSQWGDTLITDMANIVGISLTDIKLANTKSGGAQYYGKGLDHTFWEKVDRDTIALHQLLLKNKDDVYKKEYYSIHGRELKDDHTIQIWTAGMWADLWNLLLVRDVAIEKELAFSWADNTAHDYFNRNIFHNAGVSRENHLHFSKMRYHIESPFGEEFHYSAQVASFHYCKKIKATEEWLKTL